MTNQTKTQGQILVSVVAGLSLETMKQTFPQVQNQIRIMTNTACLIKAGVIAITPADDVPATLVTEVKVIFHYVLISFHIVTFRNFLIAVALQK